MVLNAKGGAALDGISVGSPRAHDVAPSQAGRPHQASFPGPPSQAEAKTEACAPDAPTLTFSRPRTHLQQTIRVTICGVGVSLRPSAAFLLLGAWCGSAARRPPRPSPCPTQAPACAPSDPPQPTP